MIKEKYVSLKIAKLLKEKGFSEQTTTFYYWDSTDYKVVHCFQNDENEVNYFKNEKENEIEIAAPTQQLVLRWLREEKNIHIYALPILASTKKYGHGDWEAVICYVDSGIDATIGGNGHIYGLTYEEAVEFAILYSLENLV